METANVAVLKFEELGWEDREAIREKICNAMYDD
jgi:hypothetical protein